MFCIATHHIISSQYNVSFGSLSYFCTYNPIILTWHESDITLCNLCSHYIARELPNFWLSSCVLFPATSGLPFFVTVTGVLPEPMFSVTLFWFYHTAPFSTSCHTFGPPPLAVIDSNCWPPDWSPPSKVTQPH